MGRGYRTRSFLDERRAAAVETKMSADGSLPEPRPETPAGWRGNSDALESPYKAARELPGGHRAHQDHGTEIQEAASVLGTTETAVN